MRLAFVLLLTAMVASSVRAGLDESFAQLIAELESETGKQVKSNFKLAWLNSLKKSIHLDDFTGDRKRKSSLQGRVSLPVTLLTSDISLLLRQLHILFETIADQLMLYIRQGGLSKQGK